MKLYAILAVLFIIGGLGVYKVSQNAPGAERRMHWTKFVTYLILVFTQALLISNAAYPFFAISVAILGLYEMISVRKATAKIYWFLIYAIMALGYCYFFYTADIRLQKFLFTLVIIFDGYSQLSGQLFGRTKLFPATSPNKTLEGLAGGLFSVIITSYILSALLEIEALKAIVLALSIALLAIAGDFLASFYKRKMGVKDYSRILPGHGGILDRFDSLIFAGFGLACWQVFPFYGSALWYFAAYIFTFLMIFFIAEIGHHTFMLKVELTRKFVHFFSGMVCLSFPFFLEDWQSVLGLCLGFIGILLISKQYNLLPSINAIERKSLGSLMFPVSVAISFMFFYAGNNYLLFYLPIVVLSVCDPLAALSGKRWAYGYYKVGREHKTLVGSAVFLVSCFLILYFSLYFYNTGLSMQLTLYCLFISIAATVAEALSKNGLDNLTIPLSITLMMWFLNML